MAAVSLVPMMLVPHSLHHGQLPTSMRLVTAPAATPPGSFQPPSPALSGSGCVSSLAARAMAEVLPPASARPSSAPSVCVAPTAPVAQSALGSKSSTSSPGSKEDTVPIAPCSPTRHQAVEFSKDDGSCQSPMSWAPPASRWWDEFAASEHVSTLESLLKDWDIVVRPILMRLFAVAEEERRGFGGAVPPGVILWDDDDLIQIILVLFDVHGLPAPKLSKQAWDALWLQHERDGRNHIDVVHAVDFVHLFTSHLHALALRPDSNHVEVAPNLFLHARGAERADWHREYSISHLSRISDVISSLDCATSFSTVMAMFKAASLNGGTPKILEWHNSEVQRFIELIYQAQQLPVPNLSRTQWHKLIDKFSRTGIDGLTFDECVEFTKFLHEEFKSGDSDLHKLFASSSCQPDAAVKQQAVVNDWRQGPETVFLRRASLQLDKRVEGLFNDLDTDADGVLQWQRSEIREFVSNWLEREGVPVPDVPEAVWYQWFREVDRDGKGLMDPLEAVNFTRHVLQRILEFHGDASLSAESIAAPCTRAATASTDAAQIAEPPQASQAKLPRLTVPNLREPTFKQSVDAQVTADAAEIPAEVLTVQEPGFRRRLLLTSSGLSQPVFLQLLADLLAERKPSGDPKVLYIPDAAVCNGCSAAAAHSGMANQLIHLGVTRIQCLELRHASREVVAHHFEDVDCIYVEMGNTYFVRYYMMTSGFDQLVQPLVDSGVIFAGASAGSMCAGRSIGIAFWKGWDNPGYGTEWDLQTAGYQGLDLIPGGRSVFPHYGAQWQALAQAKQRDTDHQVLLLDEDHACLVTGNTVEMVSASSRVALDTPARTPTFPVASLPVGQPLQQLRRTSQLHVSVTLSRPLGLTLETLEPGGGVHVTCLQQGGSALASGKIGKGDLVLMVEGHDVSSLDAEDVMELMQAAPYDVKLTFLPATAFPERVPQRSSRVAAPDSKAVVREFTVTLAKPMGMVLEDAEPGGVIVESLEPGGAAQATRLVERGDRQRAAGGERIARVTRSFGC